MNYTQLLLEFDPERPDEKSLMITVHGETINIAMILGVSMAHSTVIAIAAITAVERYMRKKGWNLADMDVELKNLLQKIENHDKK